MEEQSHNTRKGKTEKRNKGNEIMESGVILKPRVIKTYGRMTRVKHVDSAPASSSGLGGFEIEKINEEGALLSESQQMLEGFQTGPSSIFHNVPRSRRSNGRASRKEMAKVVDSGDHEGSLKWNRSNKCRRGTRKRKSKTSADTSDSEVYTPRFRIRGQPRGPVNHGSSMTQQGKLDTKTFQCFFENIWSGFSPEKRNLFAYLDCLWFSLYNQSYFKEKVLNWVKRKDIFSKRYVFVPIVMWSHWSLLILCHFGESPESKTRTPCMLLLDSLQLTNPRRLEPGIRKFVLDIHKIEERPGNKEAIRKLPLLVPKVPQQRNGDECGNYILYYLNLFLENAPESFNISEGYPYFMKEDWFTLEGLNNFCKKLDSIPKDSLSSEDD